VSPVANLSIRTCDSLGQEGVHLKSVFTSVMAGLELRRSTSLYTRLDENQKDIARSIIARSIDFVPDDLCSRIVKIWSALDQDKNGLLTREDFVSTIPIIHAALQEIWVWLSENADFDSDGRVNDSEFLAYFVLNALTNIPKMDIPSANVLEQFIACKAHFREALEEVIVEVERHTGTMGSQPQPELPQDLDV